MKEHELKALKQRHEEALQIFRNLFEQVIFLDMPSTVQFYLPLIFCIVRPCNLGGNEDSLRKFEFEHIGLVTKSLYRG